MAHRPCNFPVVGFSIEAMDGTAQTSRYLSSTTGNTTLPPAKVLTNAHSCSPAMRKSHVTVHLDGAIRCSGLANLSDLRPLHASSLWTTYFIITPLRDSALTIAVFAEYLHVHVHRAAATHTRSRPRRLHAHTCTFTFTAPPSSASTFTLTLTAP